MLGGLLVMGAAQSLIAADVKAKQRKAALDACDPDVRAELLRKYEQQDKEELDHRRALEIADRLRPRNFWGQ